MNSFIFNNVNAPLALSYKQPRAYTQAIIAGDAYYFQVSPSFSIFLLTLITRYYCLQIVNPTLSTKGISVQNLTLKRTLSGLSGLTSLDTELYFYEGGTLSSANTVTTSNVNPSTGKTSIAQVKDVSFQLSSPLTGGNLIDQFSIVSNDYTYFYDYSNELIIPANKTLSILIKVNIVSALSLTGSVSLNLSLRYTEENP